MKYKQNLLLGALLVVLAELCMASMGALVKTLGQTTPHEMAVFARNLAGLLVLMPLLWGNRSLSLKTNCLHLHLLRSLSGVAAMYCFFYAIIHLPLADSMLLKMTAPIFMPIIAILWLKESITVWTVFALIIGFVGVWIIVNPTGDVNWIALVGVAGGLLAGLAKVTIRRLSRTEPITRIVFYFAITATAISALPAIAAWVTPNMSELLLMAGIGFVGTAGQLALTRAYSVSNPGTVAPLTYFSVIFGGIYGYVFWQEIPSIQFVVGAFLISMAGILTLRKSGFKSSFLQSSRQFFFKSQ